jgi:hypothetical protein
MCEESLMQHTAAHVRVDAHVPRRPREALVFPVRDVAPLPIRIFLGLRTKRQGEKRPIRFRKI